MIGWLLGVWALIIVLLVLAEVAFGAPRASTRRIARVCLWAVLAVAAGVSIGHLLLVWGIA